MIALKTQ